MQQPKICTCQTILAICLLLTLIVGKTCRASFVHAFMTQTAPFAIEIYEPIRSRKYSVAKRSRTTPSSTWTTKQPPFSKGSGSNATSPSIDRPMLSTRTKQQRRKPRRPRRPREYWSDLDNLEVELRLFWDDVSVPLSAAGPPPIPNESLLNHFERNDLRWAIAKHGGRKAVSHRLGGAQIIPGKWAEAVEKSAEVQRLLDPSNEAGTGLSRDLPPLSPQERRKTEMAASEMRGNINAEMKPNSLGSNGRAIRWQHQPGRKPKGYWNQKVVIWELREYCEDYKRERQRPPVWMPRLSELAVEGKNDLKGAITRFGGYKKICKLAGLVPFAEWNFFEMQFGLVLDLQDYLRRYHDGDETTCFPSPSTIQINGYESLYSAIQQFGGQKFVASKLGMKTYAANDGSRRRSSSADFMQLNFGPFSVDFAVRLLSYIREDMMQKKAPLSPPVIQMPTKATLITSGEYRLAEEVDQFGGYENVARRLGLAMFEEQRIK